MASKETLAKNSHISDREIETDIADTQCEIDRMRQEAKAYENLSQNHSNPNERKMASFRLSATLSGIEQRVEFVKKLIDLLNSRKPTEDTLSPQKGGDENGK